MTIYQDEYTYWAIYKYYKDVNVYDVEIPDIYGVCGAGETLYDAIKETLNILAIKLNEYRQNNIQIPYTSSYEDVFLIAQNECTSDKLTIGEEILGYSKPILWNVIQIKSGDYVKKAKEQVLSSEQYEKVKKELEIIHQCVL